MTEAVKVKNIYESILIAILAGFTPIVLKYISRDQQAFVDLLNWSYLWTGVTLSVLGFIACYLSGEKSRMKLFAIAISAPALFSNMTGETNTASARASAADTGSAANPINALQGYIGEKNYYSVSIFSGSTFDSANKLASAINAKYPDLEAHVGNRRIDDKYYSVIIGSAREYDAAKLLASLADERLIDSPTGKKGFWLDENQQSWLKLYRSSDCRGQGTC